MLLSYDGVNNLIKNRYNIGAVTKLDTGHYRVRMENKTQGGEFAVTMVSVFEQTGEVIFGYIFRQTDRIVEVKVKRKNDTPIDAHVNLMMYNPIV